MVFIFCVLSACLFETDAEDPTVTVTEGELLGKTALFEENEFINVSKMVDLFLVSIIIMPRNSDAVIIQV